jgi:hypothetical protein
MDWYDRKFDVLLMDTGKGTSGVRLMDHLKKSGLYRWMGTGSTVYA